MQEMLIYGWVIYFMGFCAFEGEDALKTKEGRWLAVGISLLYACVTAAYVSFSAFSLQLIRAGFQMM